MTVSKEATEAALTELRPLAIHPDDMERALTSALPFLARLAPSQSDRDEAADILRIARDPCFTYDDAFDAILDFAAAVRAEATLAGAAAERETIVRLEAELASGPSITQLAAKDREIAAFEAEKKRVLLSFDVLRSIGRKEIAALREALNIFIESEIDYMDRNNLGDAEKQHRVIVARAALSMSPAPDPAEAMRAKCEKLARERVARLNSFDDGVGIEVGNCIANDIAALKGNGEGK